MFESIATPDLRLEHLPARESDWMTFALTFNGYEHWGEFERCAQIANDAQAQYEASREVPDDLDMLRTCLFFEQRRWRHFGEYPDAEAMTYIRALLEATRKQVAKQSP